MIDYFYRAPSLARCPPPRLPPSAHRARGAPSAPPMPTTKAVAAPQVLSPVTSDADKQSAVQLIRESWEKLGKNGKPRAESPAGFLDEAVTDATNKKLHIGYECDKVEQTGIALVPLHVLQGEGTFPGTWFVLWSDRLSRH